MRSVTAPRGLVERNVSRRLFHQSATDLAHLVRQHLHQLVELETPAERGEGGDLQGGERDGLAKAA